MVDYKYVKLNKANNGTLTLDVELGFYFISAVRDFIIKKGIIEKTSSMGYDMFK